MVGRDNPIETEFIGDVDRAYLIKFFGLHERNVEWFRIEELQKYGCRANALHPHDFDASLQQTAEPPFFYSETGRMEWP